MTDLSLAAEARSASTAARAVAASSTLAGAPSADSSAALSCSTPSSARPPCSDSHPSMVSMPVALLTTLPCTELQPGIGWQGVTHYSQDV